MNILIFRPQSKENKILKNKLEQNYKINIDIIEIVKIKILYYNLKKAINLLDNYTFVGFTSQNGVKILYNYLKKRDMLNKLSDKKFIAIGCKTAEKITQLLGSNVQVTIPDKYYTESLAYLLKKTNQSCLLLRSLLSIHINLPNVKEIYIYTLKPINKNFKINFEKYNYIILTSSFITKVFFEKFKNFNFNGYFVPIGPTTYKTLVNNTQSRIINYPDKYTIEDTIKKIISRQ